MWRAYQFILGLWHYLSAPIRAYRRSRRADGRDEARHRSGDYNSKIKHAITNRHVLWLHAGSEAEINLCTQLIAALEPRLPNLKMVVSTSNSAGMTALHAKVPSHILKIYSPTDRRDHVGRALKTMHPRGIVLLAEEFQPNFLRCAREMRLPLFLVSVPSSRRPQWRLKLFSPLFRPLFDSFRGVACQDETGAARLRELGFRPEVIQVVGNLKFDAAQLDERRLLDVPHFLRQIGVPPTARLLVGGGTHAGEEAALAEVFQRLKPRFPDLFLILVPRQCERGKEVSRALENCGIKFVYRKDITSQTQLAEGSTDCLLVNTSGELKNFYECATIIFVGKSLTAEGGQNPLEPGILGKPMIFGPNMRDYQAITDTLLAQGGAMQVRDVRELEAALADLLADPTRAIQVGRNAQMAIRENHREIERIAAMVISNLKSSVYMTDRS